MSKIHPTAIVDANAQLGDDVEIGPFCIVGADVTIGARTTLKSHNVIDGVTTIGEDNQLRPFAALGGPPQHLAYKGEPTRLIVGDRNFIGEYMTMHIGTPGGRGVTTVGSDGFFMPRSVGM
jgi:UDP-N-acetylglucosamine acyltransferase